MRGLPEIASRHLGSKVTLHWVDVVVIKNLIIMMLRGETVVQNFEERFTYIVYYIHIERGVEPNDITGSIPAVEARDMWNICQFVFVATPR